MRFMLKRVLLAVFVCVLIHSYSIAAETEKTATDAVVKKTSVTAVKENWQG